MAKCCFAIPVSPQDADKATATFQKWMNMGYDTACLVYETPFPTNYIHLLLSSPYKGWPWAVNELCRMLANYDWIITGGADIYPDPIKRADEIADECYAHFNGTLGVMQPSADKYGAIETSSAAVSPWLGREFRNRVNGGTGPMCELYGHYYADGELMHVAQRLGTFWWRNDLNQYHDHYGRKNEPLPEHLKFWSARSGDDRNVFETRIRKNFPGHQLA